MTPEDALKVELVQTLWDQAAPWVAILISISSIGLTLWLRHHDNARLKLGARMAIPIGSGGKDIAIRLEAINVGRSGQTTVRGLSFEAPNGDVLMVPPMRPHPLNTPLPATLGPGESARVLVRVASVVEACRANGFDPKHLRIVADGGHGSKRRRPHRKFREGLAGFVAEAADA